MATILTNNFKYKNTEEIRKLFHDVNERGKLKHHVYLFIARSRAWPKVDNVEVTDVPSSLASMQEELDVHNDIIVLKKINAEDISIVAPKYVWDDENTNVAFTTWEHDSSTIFERDGTGSNAKPFYVAAQESSTDWSIWKCLMNVGGVSTTTKPTISGMTSIHTKGDGSTDGYVWKYMYSVTNAQMTKFSSSVADSSGKLWMPVKTLFKAPTYADTIGTTSQWDVQRQAVRGGVHLIRPTSAIIAADSTKLIRLDGDGEGFEGTIQYNSTLSKYYVQVTAPGTGYTFVRRIMKQTAAGGGSSEFSDYGADSNLTAVLSPIGGHGWNAMKELGGHRIMIYTTLEGNRSFGSGGVSYQHAYGGADGNDYTDYRTVGLMVDPIQSYAGSDDIRNGTQKGDIVTTGDRVNAADATNLTRLQYATLSKDGSTIVNDSDWREKEIMQVDGTGTTDKFIATGRIVDINTVSKYLYVIPYAGRSSTTYASSKFEPDAGSYVFLNESGTLSSANYFTITEVKANDILPYSGDIIYLDNRAQIIRDVTRTETIRIVIEF